MFPTKKSLGNLSLFGLLVLSLVGINCQSLVPVERDNSAFKNETLAFSTSLGGSKEDTIRDVTTDDEGNVYVTGGTASPDFPVTSSAYDRTFNGRHDVFVSKLGSDGKIIWSTLIGGPNYDRTYAIEVSSQGYIYVAGRAGDGYPTTPGSVQPNFGGDVNANNPYGPQDGFVSKFSRDGSQLIWSTYFGSDDSEIIRDIAVDEVGDVYLAVSDIARPHPHITSQAFQTSLRGSSDGVVAKISADGAKVIYASYFGGSADDGGTPSIRVDGAGNAFYLCHTRSADAPITSNAFQPTPGGGVDLILGKVSADGSKLIYSTYLGGADVDFTETHGLDVDPQGNAYIGFTTKSPGLRTTAHVFQSSYGGSGQSGTGVETNYPGDGFVAKISKDGSQLLAATYIGGKLGEGIEGIAVDSQSNVHIGGATYSDDFPVTADSFQSKRGGKGDFFAVRLSADFSKLDYATYVGGRENDYGRAIAVDSVSNLYVAGMSSSVDWPTSQAQAAYSGGDSDAVLTKFILTGTKITPKMNTQQP